MVLRRSVPDKLLGTLVTKLERRKHAEPAPVPAPYWLRMFMYLLAPRSVRNCVRCAARVRWAAPASQLDPQKLAYIRGNLMTGPPCHENPGNAAAAGRGPLGSRTVSRSFVAGLCSAGLAPPIAWRPSPGFALLVPIAGDIVGFLSVDC